MGKSPSPALQRAMATSTSQPPTQTDKLDILKQHASTARDLELQINDLGQQAQALGAQLNLLYQTTLPDLLEEVGLDRIGVPQDGNKPGVDYVLTNYYSANIAQSWDEVRRSAGFAVLKQYKAESLIKTEVSAKLPKGSLKVAKQLVALAKKQLKITADLKQSVHGGTLSSWLRELYEGGGSLPARDLEKIGGSVGRVVKPKERKE